MQFEARRASGKGMVAGRLTAGTPGEALDELKELLAREVACGLSAEKYYVILRPLGGKQIRRHVVVQPLKMAQV